MAYVAYIETLREWDFRTIAGLLEKLYQPAGLHQFRKEMGGYLRDFIPCDLAAYSEMNPDEETSLHLGSPEGILTPKLTRERWLPVMHEHPVLAHIQQTGDLRAYRMSDFYSEAQFHRLALYHEFYRHINVQDGLCSAIAVAGAVVVGASFHRDRRSFTDRECLMVNLIRPHITQAWRNAHEMSRMRQRIRAQAQALEAQDCDIVILGPRGNIHWMPPRASALLQEFFGYNNGIDRQLPSAVTQWIRHRKSESSLDHVPEPRSPLEVVRDNSRLTMRLLTSSSQDLLLLRVQRHSAHRSRLLRLGLTRREAEVLHWVGEGKTNREISSILDASPRTIQKHLEHIFQKFGVETRTAAVIRMRELA